MQSKVDNVLGKGEVSRQGTLSSTPTRTVSRTKSNNTIDLFAELETVEVLSEINEISEVRSRTNSYVNDAEEDIHCDESSGNYLRRRACSEILSRESYKPFDTLYQSVSSPNVSINKEEPVKPKRPPRRKKVKTEEKESKSREYMKLTNLKSQLINDFIPLKRKKSKKYKRMTLNSIKTIKNEDAKLSNNQLQVPIANFITSKSTSRSSSICSIRSNESLPDEDTELKDVSDAGSNLEYELSCTKKNTCTEKNMVALKHKKGEMFPLHDSSFCPVNFQSTNF